MKKKKEAETIDPRRVTHALSVRAGPAREICDGRKTVEYRSWPLPDAWLHCPIALHESGAAGRGVLAVISFDAAVAGAWHIGSVRLLSSPVPCRGALRFWRLPEPVRAEVVRRIAERRDARQ